MIPICTLPNGCLCRSHILIMTWLRVIYGTSAILLILFSCLQVSACWHWRLLYSTMSAFGWDAEEARNLLQVSICLWVAYAGHATYKCWFPYNLPELMEIFQGKKKLTTVPLGEGYSQILGKSYWRDMGANWTLIKIYFRYYIFEM